MKNIIVTGGLGFIGSNLVKKLSQKYYVHIVDKNTYSSNIDNLRNIKKGKYKLHKFDIRNQNKFYILLKKVKPILIYNLAAETHVDRSIENAKSFIDSNIIGFFSILESLKKFYKKNKNIKLIHISTDEVYGDINGKKFSKEVDAFNPSSPYAASKASSDLLAKAYIRTYKLPIIITNCCNNYGPNQFPEKLIPKLITNILNNKNLPIYGNGKNMREWIHVDDHNNALIKISNKGIIGNSYNIGSGEILNNIQIAKMLLKIISKKLKYKTKSRIIFVKDRPGHDLRYALNSNKIKKELKWKKKYKIYDGLLATVLWYVNNKDWVNKINKKKYDQRIGLKI